MRYLLAFILSVSAYFAHAQQVNPVTDYTFANRMSSGRSTVTDTAAYFSIGPRYGAVRGMMPPMVTDTTAMSANKRNGLLIFSIQKNKYQVWDSAGAKWADITGAAGSAIISADTAAMLLPYLRKADTTAMLLPYLRKSDTTAMLLPYLRDADTTAMLSPYLKESDTVWLSNRINLKVNIADTSSMLTPYLRGSGTANYFPKFDASRSVINSKLYESGTNLLFNTTTPSFTSAGITTIENNATSSAVYTYKISDTLRAYMGFGGANTFDINNISSGDIRFYTAATLRGRFQTDGTFRLNSLTGTGDRIVTADANGVLSATSSATGLVDTTVLSTRAWRQKGDDSLGAIIATKGSGTVTSVATGYGLSGGTITTTGTIIVDSAIVASRLRVGKVVDSLALVKQNVLTNPVTGTGTTNYVPKFTGTSTIGSSTIFDDGEVKINTTSDQGDYKLQLAGNMWVNGSAILGYTSGSNTGIRTPSPTSPLTVFNPTANTTVLEVRGGGGSSQSRIVMNYGTETAITAENALILSNTTEFTFRGRSGRTMTFYTDAGSGEAERARITTSGELLLNTTTDAGDYKLQVSGNAYVTGTTVLAATSGNVAVGGTTANAKIHLYSNNSTTYSTTNTLTSGTSMHIVNDAGVNNIASTIRLDATGNGSLAAASISGIYSGVATSALTFGTRFSGSSVTEKIRIHGDGGLKFVGQSAAPTAEAGTVYYDTDDNKLKVYNGTTWVDLH